MGGRRIVICGAGVIGASVARALARRGAPPLVVDRAGTAAAASGKASGFLALDWSAGTPLDAMGRAGFTLHRQLAAELGPDRIGYRPTDALMTAAADTEDLEPYRRLPNPAWLDGNVVAHEVIGGPGTTAQVNPRAFTEAVMEDALAHGAELRTGVVDGLRFDDDGTVRGVSVDGGEVPADVVVLALGPWTDRAQRWLALPQVLGTRMASAVLAADLPPQVVFSEFLAADGRRVTFRIYPRAGGAVYVTGHPEHGALPDDPADIVPDAASVAELHRIAGVHASALRDAEVVTRTACYRAITVDGLPLIGPVPWAPGTYLATAHGSWGLLTAPATGRMVAEMILDGGSRSLDASPFALTRLPAGRM